MRNITCLLTFLFLPFQFQAQIESASCLTKNGYIAAISKDYLDKATQYAVDKDYVAFQKLLDAEVIFSIKGGVKVFIVDSHIFKGTVEFRLPGDINVFWTVIEAIDC